MIDERKFAERIKHKIEKCTYIGDISINDEEYDLLMESFRNCYRAMCDSLSHESLNPLFAVSLVQIGLRYYDGRFWPYVAQELGLKKVPGNHQAWIGTSFYKILLKYHKYHVEQTDQNKFMNNILLHCFITKYYAADLFDFLFDYYRIDLDRDLNNNDRQMRDYLMQSMSKGEQTARAYKIKKHTADAVSANTRGCKIRVGRILRFMDNALFNDTYPTNSQNRVAQLFCEWARSSDKFDVEKKRTRGVTHNGEKRFSTPYLHFDTKRDCFCLILPPQYIRLDESEELPSVEWRIDVQGTSPQILSVSSESCVTGCKTEKKEQILSPESLLNEINIELWKNGSVRLKRFKIKSDCIRFFDSEWDLIDSATYIKYLPIGKAYAFCSPTEVVLSDSNSIIDCEKKLGYDLYTLNLEKGDVLRLPDGKAKSVGKPLEEGVLSQNLVSGAYAVRDGEKFDVYNSIPSVYFRMTPKQENGTLIVINGEKHRFDFERCVRFEVDEKTEEKGYILKLKEYTVADGIYEIIIDVPNSRKERRYSFTFLPGFSYHYDQPSYLFQDKGTITFPGNTKIRLTKTTSPEYVSQFDFDILPEKDELSVLYDATCGTINVQICIPALKWSFDNERWSIDRPEEIWYKEFPKTIYLKYPDDEISFSMSPQMLESSDEDDEDSSFSKSFSKNREIDIFECDTRKIISWFGYEEPVRVLTLKVGGWTVPFVSVIIRCFLNGEPTIQENKNPHELVIKSKISGFSDCVADVFFENKMLAEKQPITTSGIHLSVPVQSGKYRIAYYEWDDDDDDFGFADYRKFDEKTIRYESLNDLSGKTIIVTGIEQRKQETFFTNQFKLRVSVKITELVSDEADNNSFCGKSVFNGVESSLRVTMCNPTRTKAQLSFYSEEDQDYFDFLFDKTLGSLVLEEDESIDARQRKDRYALLDSEEYVFLIQIR